MLVIRGAVKDYDWGIVDGLARWSGQTTGAPQAELWFGVHPGGPSPLVDGSGRVSGEVLADHFDVEHIPILVKLLAAGRPLSVQVHPRAERARLLWQAQQSGEGRAVLSDPFEKTEMLVALEPFAALVGWRDTGQVVAMLRAVPGCTAAADAVDAGDREQAIRALLAVTPVAPAVASLPAAAESAGLSRDEIDAYRSVADNFPDDVGALVTPLLGYTSLAPGEAVYVPAGIPHSYVRGIGVEVMTSSDNVLRLGLTPKAVFVDEALGTLDDSVTPTVLRATVGEVIAPEGAPFQATLLRDDTVEAPTGRYRIVLLIEGSVRIASDLGSVELVPGTAAVLAADDPTATLTVAGLVAVLTAAGAPRGPRGATSSKGPNA